MRLSELSAYAHAGNHRLIRGRMAGKDVKRAIHSLQTKLQAVNGTVEEQQQRLIDLSNEVRRLQRALVFPDISRQTDDSIAQHVNLALRATQDVVAGHIDATNGRDVLDGHHVDITSFSERRAAEADRDLPAC